MKADLNCGICVLAGGMSTRMGSEKPRLLLGRRTMLGQIRASAEKLGLPVRVIRRDQVPRCGPLGGIYTALKTTRADAELFLACDMPFVSTDLLSRILYWFKAHRREVFITTDRRAGFPFLLPRKSLAAVEAQILNKEFSVQTLARVLQAKLLRPPREMWKDLCNVNTPGEWQAARLRWEREHRPE